MRSHYCGDLVQVSAGETVKVAGWIHQQRDLGGLAFLQVRDRSGIIQVAIDPDQADLLEIAKKLRNEFVV